MDFAVKIPPKIPFKWFLCFSMQRRSTLRMRDRKSIPEHAAKLIYLLNSVKWFSFRFWSLCNRKWFTYQHYTLVYIYIYINASNATPSQQMKFENALFVSEAVVLFTIPISTHTHTHLPSSGCNGLSPYKHLLYNHFFSMKFTQWNCCLYWTFF